MKGSGEAKAGDPGPFAFHGSTFATVLWTEHSRFGG
jgi:hypothetical protein